MYYIRQQEQQRQGDDGAAAMMGKEIRHQKTVINNSWFFPIILKIANRKVRYYQAHVDLFRIHGNTFLVVSLVKLLPSRVEVYSMQIW